MVAVLYNALEESLNSKDNVICAIIPAWIAVEVNLTNAPLVEQYSMRHINNLIHRYKQHCYKYCPENTYRDEGSLQCRDCPSNCDSCDKDKCDSCEEGFYLSGGTCVSECGDGFFTDDISRECEPCHKNCATCVGYSYENCTGCKNGFQLSRGQCLNPRNSQSVGKFWSHLANAVWTVTTYIHPGSMQLSSDTYIILWILRPVPGPCKQWVVLVQEVQRCCSQNGSDKENSANLLVNLEQLYPVLVASKNNDTIAFHNPVQVACTSVATHPRRKGTCEKSADKCTTCPEECMDQFFLHEGKCVQECPSHFYAEDKHCFPCHANCKGCNGPDSDDCTACTFSLFVLYNGMCFEECPEGSYYEEATGDCQDTTCVETCPDGYYADSDEGQCSACHSACVTCTGKYSSQCLSCKPGKGAFSCTSCVWSYSLLGGMCNSDCFVGEYRVQETPGQEEDEPKCEKCDSSCTECKGPGPLNCTVCPASMQLYLEESRCLPCCSASDPAGNIECCDCSETQDDCVLQTTVPPKRKSKTTFFVITCILLLLVIGAIVFIWRRSRAKTQAVNKGRYEKLTNHSKTFPSSVSNYHKSTSYQEDQVIEYRDRDNEDYDDEEDDIVYMSQDGTIYRKFKYGLLEDDEEDELEYDDESYSFR
ncbi:hypothetical protein BTVI_09195 [Pitangus sulphuratus]|nr:hypothetical protein BTVI_09195 [Pitangus sulphuratus]